MWDSITQWISQFFVLLWKNLKLRFKSKLALLAELIAPIFLFLLWVSFMATGLNSEGSLPQTLVKPLQNFVNAKNMLLFAPATPEVNNLMQIIANDSLNTDSPAFQGFPTFDLLNQFYLNNSNKVFAGLWFGEGNGSVVVTPTNITSYSISMDNTLLASTDKQADSEGHDAANSYLSEGFISLQVAVDMAIMKAIGDVELIKTANVSVIQFPKDSDPMWKQWGRSTGFGQAGVVFFLIGLFASCFRMMTNRVAEKEKKIRELLRMGGLRRGVESASWWATTILIAIGPIIAAVYILKGVKIYHSSDMNLVVLLFVFAFFSLIALAQLLSVFINKAKFAGVFGLLVVVVFGAVGIALSVKDNVSGSLQLFLCIFSPTGFAVGNGIIFKLEDQGVGLQGQQYNHGHPSVRDVVGMLCFDSILYIVLSWYFDSILPGEYGTAKSPLFVFRKFFWSSLFSTKNGVRPMPDDTTPITKVVSNSKRQPSENQGWRPLDEGETMPLNTVRFPLEKHLSDTPDVEAVGNHMKGKEAVTMWNVRKEFSSNHIRKVAVDDLSVTLYEDQITALLGHNGAGKTTTISMLTGLIPPTSGEAYINGWSIVNKMDQIRSSLLLGVCPQANVLWDEFSVEDHLKIHAGLKGVKLFEIRETIDTMIKDLGLEEKRHTPSSALSGGQKRKLQLAISFLGNSKVIFLDEPTSGMDPVTRRSVWDFLNKYKTGKAIILTTHFMDEADILGDRIVVVSQGKVRCAGTSLFLKSRFGVGYLLTMVKTPACNPDSLDTLIKSHVKDAAKLSDFGAELSYRLPSKDLEKFSELFSEIDKSQEALGLDSYGISLTTLEEVFLRIGIEEKEKEKAEQSAIDIAHSVPAAVKHTDALNNKPPGGHSFFQQFYALFVKRMQCAPRDYRTMLFALVIPLALIAGAIALGKAVPVSADWYTQHTDPLVLSGFNFPDTHVALQGGTLVGSGLIVGDQYVTVPSTTPMHNYLITVRDYVAALTYPINSTYDNATLQLDYLIWFNKTYDHTLPISVNLADSALLRFITNNTHGIDTTIRPFVHVLTAGELALTQSNPNNVIYFSMLFMAGFAMILGGLIMPLAQERALNIKRLLLVSGTSKLAYWISAFTWDLIIMFAVSLISLILLAIVNIGGFRGEGWGAGLLVLILYSLAGLTMTYVFSLRIGSYATSMAQVFAYHFLFAFFLLAGYVSVAINAAVTPSAGLNTATKILAKVFCALSPNFNLGYCFLTLLNFASPTPRNGRSWLSMDILGFPCLMLLAHAVFWWSLLMLLEYRSSMKIRKLYKPNVFHEAAPADEDFDVVTESQRVAGNTDDVILVRGMRKEYPEGKNNVKVAVANLSLGVPMGQCFGLLGMNGAGKSTTLGVLSADVAPTAGDVFLNGHNLLTDPGDALRYFGWCPQFDALVDTLTGREQLTLYARIKGLPEPVIRETVNSFLEVLDMEYLADRLAGGYSGGNKRKLSLAIAMIGNPPIVFLDEPSTGMDPLSKRLMWRVITQLGHDKAIIVTTHYMEECEALCSRIGIMSQGRLVCLGSSQHLKSRFATGYTIQIKAKPGHVDAVHERVAQVFPTAQLTDAHDDMLAYQLPVASAGAGGVRAGAGSIAPIFAALVDMREITDDYAVSQTTLEQVFLKLAKEKDTTQP